MYAYFRGIIREKSIDKIILETNNIGYNIFFSPGKMSYLPPIGEETVIYTYTSVKENELALYGFVSKEELEIFSMLITVSGIGPKGGMALLSELSATEIKIALLTGDEKTLSKAKGISDKTAKRLILGLKGKIDADSVLSTGVELSADPVGADPDVRDAVEALTALGYSIRDARAAVANAKKDGAVTTDELLKGALKYFL